jgi:hypothetical protein
VRGGVAVNPDLGDSLGCGLVLGCCGDGRL